MEPISLYVHIPFCVQKCRYCDFLSTADDSLVKDYFNALSAEIEHKAQNMLVDTIFIGGGTPTCVPYSYITTMIQTIARYWLIQPQAEITIEANPGTVNLEQLMALRASGVNRISFGAQASQNKLLHTLGRIHDCMDTQQSFSMARNAGFSNINLDLMFALPTQQMRDWQESLAKITELAPEHISAYGLIVEEGTPLYEDVVAGRLTVPDEESYVAMAKEARTCLKEAGYCHYEISNFARPGYECRHNSAYWRCSSYVGLGLGAHSYMRGKRYHNTIKLQDYIKRNFEPFELIRLNQNEQQSEFLFMGLRMLDGVKAVDFLHQFGVSLMDVYGKEITKLTKMGLIVSDGTGIRLTPKAIDISNMVFSEFV